MRILVAEDHPSLARSIADGLRDEGYAVDLTFDGNEALHLASSNPYDAIILDIMLPGKDGFAIIQTLRLRDVHIPILCLTAKDAVTDRVNGLDLGVDDYIGYLRSKIDKDFEPKLIHTRRGQGYLLGVEA